TSGLETIPYTLGVIGCLVALERGSFLLAGLIAALATLLRPDGVLLVFTAVVVLIGQPSRQWLRFSGAFTVVVSPWLLYAIETYGSFIPHSVAAKRLIHPSSPLANLLIIAESFSRNPVEFLLFVSGLAGVIWVSRERRRLV